MKTRNSLSIVIALLVLVYGAGESCQTWYLEAPRWIRWHLSDLGFVGDLTFLFNLFYRPLATRDGVPIHHQKTVIMVAATVFWLMCLIWEAGQEIKSGSGDIIDAICYTVALVAIFAAYRADSRQVREP